MAVARQLAAQQRTAPRGTGTHVPGNVNNGLVTNETEFEKLESFHDEAEESE